MRHDPTLKTRFFFTTTPLPCPYLDDRMEQRMVTELMGSDSTDLGERLSRAGFRRSHTISYTPVCEGCSACMSVRIPVSAFKANKSQRKILKQNSDLRINERPPKASQEQYTLFKNYIDARHGDGDMAMMNENDYISMIEETTVLTSMFEFRDTENHLVAGCLADRFNDGVSAIYSFFDVNSKRRSLGTFVVLSLIENMRRMGLDYVYLGYWVQDSQKMDYKRNFKPLEGFTPTGWKRLENKR